MAVQDLQHFSKRRKDIFLESFDFERFSLHFPKCSNLRNIQVLFLTVSLGQTTPFRFNFLKYFATAERIRLHCGEDSSK